MDNNNDRRKRLSITFAHYAEEAQARSRSIAVLVAEKPTSDALQKVSLQAHSLAGSGTTMGVEEITLLSRDIEKIIHEIGAGSPTDDQTAALAGLAAQLTQAAAAFDPETRLDEFMKRMFPNG